MNRAFTSIKLAVQFFFFKIVILWAKAAQYTIGILWQWADTKYKQLQEIASKSLIEEDQKNDINDFVKSMQRQAKVIGVRPKKDKGEN